MDPEFNQKVKNSQKTNDPCLKLFMGPMGSGKTNELMKNLNDSLYLEKKCIFINSVIDNRNEADIVSTHSKLINTSKVKELIDIVKRETVHDMDWNEYQCIFIDELAFMKDSPEQLYDKINNELINNHKQIFIAMLSGNSDQKLFGNGHILIPIATHFIQFRALCYYCHKDDGKEVKAPYTIKISGNMDTETDPGGFDKYKTCCVKHLNRHLQK